MLEDFLPLETQRLILRKMIQEDAKSLFQILGDEDVMRYHSTSPLVHIQEAQQIIERANNMLERQQGMRLGITFKGSDVVVGTCGYLWDRDNFLASLGGELAKAYWNKGIMTEALETVIRFCFEQFNFHRIEAQIIVNNGASIRMVQKLGFQEEGILRERLFANNRFHDMKMVSLLKEDFMKRFLK